MTCGQDKRLGGQRRDIDVITAAKRMVLRHGDDERLAREDRGLERRVVERQVEERDVKAPLMQAANKCVGRHLAQG